MSQKHQFVRDLLTGKPELSVIAALLEAGSATLDRKLATIMLIAEQLEGSYSNPGLTKHILENYIKVLDVIESYKIELPEEISVIENAIAMLTEDGGAAGGGGAPAVSGGSGAAAGSVSTAAIAATRQVDTTAIDAKTPRIYPRKKKPSKTA